MREEGAMDEEALMRDSIPWSGGLVPAERVFL